MKYPVKRSQEKRTTKPARVLRFMRMSKRISMRAAGRMVGLSDSWVSHIEQGRLDLDDRKISRLIDAYGFSRREYETLLNGGEVPFNNIKDECIALIDQIDDAKLRTVLAVLRGFMT